MKIVELSHQMEPGKEEYLLDISTHQIEELYPQYHRRPQDWYILQTINLNAHVGTHIESPFHHRKDGHDISQIPLDKLIGSAVKLDFTHKKPGEIISRDELAEAAQPYQLRGKIVFVHTGRDKFYHDQFSGHERPYPSPEAIGWLVEEGISCLAIDATGIEVKGLDYQPNHQTLFAANIPLVENVTNLESLRNKEFAVYILPLNVIGLESCPVRIIAVDGDEVQ